MTGELDLRTAIPQTEEYYSALKVLKVPVVMLDSTVSTRHRLQAVELHAHPALHDELGTSAPAGETTAAAGDGTK